MAQSSSALGSSMRICKFRNQEGDARTGIVEADSVVPLLDATLTQLLEAEDPDGAVNSATRGEAVPLASVVLLAPIDAQEVWAAGVTYKRSQAARMEESEAAASCYDRVYVADRPELFLKATPSRVVGPSEPIRIRQDATWNVPEPEVTLVVNSRKQLVGFTVGNDMSSRDIEGENPLYLPQAKVYNQCCGLGPWITLTSGMPAFDNIGVGLRVLRNQEVVFEGTTSTSQMARSFEHLIGYLGRDNDFPDGVYLLTGTGIVPDSSFTLAPDDVVEISVDGVGTLTNVVVQG